MQTFVPEDTPERIAGTLDFRRLGKQRVEVLQILRALTGGSHGWRTHPATVMWADNPGGLAHYGVTICDHWVELGYKDTCRDKIAGIVTPDPDDLPWWWGHAQVMESHRSNLIRKDPGFYERLWPGTPRDLPYLWPRPDGWLVEGKHWA